MEQRPERPLLWLYLSAAAHGSLRRGVVVRLGGTLQTMLGGSKKVEIEGRMVDHEGGGVVHLRVTKEELKRAA